MSYELNDLHDYSLVAWALDQSSWTMVFDIHHPERSIHQGFQGIKRWYASGLRSPIGVLELNVWRISPSLLNDSKALRSWTRLFGYACSPDEVRGFASPLIEENEGQALVAIETVDGGTVDLICEQLSQRVL